MALDPQFNPNQTPSAADFWAVFKSLLPVSVVACIGAILYHMTDACRERTWGQRLTVLFVSGCTGFVLGPLVTVFIHEYMPEHSHMFHMAVGCAIGSMGTQSALMIARGVRKLITLDPSNTDDLALYREKLSPKEREEHANSCVFTPDRCGGACMDCPHRQEHNHEKEERE